MNRTEMPEYSPWLKMRSRCLSPTSQGYPAYGGRGITICPQWGNFLTFLADMGPRPSRAYSIERKDNDGNYEPSNCVWATAKEQARNRRSSRYVVVGGERVNLAERAEAIGMNGITLHMRLLRGMTPEEVVHVGKFTSGRARHGRPRVTNKSGFRGVSKKGRRWRATIVVDGHQRLLGTFDAPEDAAEAYVKANAQLIAAARKVEA